MQNFRFKCRKCGQEFLRRKSLEEFEKAQYSENGHSCESCGYPKMAVIRSNQMVKDGFKPGLQRNIMKVCNTYAEYKAQLKKMGLIEMGYEDFPEQEYKSKYWSPKMLKKLYDMGGFGDNELNAIGSGKIQGLH